MRTSPYPSPPSRTWTAVMAGTYGSLVLAGAIVLAVLVIMPQPVEGVVVLGLWGGLTLPAALLCLCGVLRARYRFEWVGAWLIVMGTSIYLVVTTMNVIAAGLMPLVSSAPTLLVFLYAVGFTVARAVQLSIIDRQARSQVLIERAATGEIPEVATRD